MGSEDPLISIAVPLLYSVSDRSCEGVAIRFAFVMMAQHLLLASAGSAGDLYGLLGSYGSL